MPKLPTEFIGTFFLVLSICLRAAGGISGGRFNPAVGTALTLVSQTGFGDRWLYWVGPLVGGVLATVVFRVQEGAP